MFVKKAVSLKSLQVNVISRFSLNMINDVHSLHFLHPFFNKDFFDPFMLIRTKMEAILFTFLKVKNLFVFDMLIYILFGFILQFLERFQ